MESPLSSPIAAPVDAIVVPSDEPEIPETETGQASSPFEWREIAALVALVVVADLTLYRGHGPAGIALFLVVAPVLFLLGSPAPTISRTLCCIAGMLIVLAGRLVWCGSVLMLPIGLALLVAFAMSLSGQRPYVLEALVFASQSVWAGYRGLAEFGRSLLRVRTGVARMTWLSVVLPATTALVFSTLFVLANPDLMEAFGEHISRGLTAVREWLIQAVPEPLEVLFWLAVLWISMGLLRPVMGGSGSEENLRGRAKVDRPAEQRPSPLYPAFRNTLIVVIALFAAYLVFEFKTLWFRVFPDGFHYSGYAHEGAAWLTVALALATVVLSAIFRGEVLRDPRLPKLQRMAWLWSVENLLLALAVYNRLFIYIGFNGMTRMRIIGLFGISAVVVGFLLVVWKIARHRDFVWLIRRHLWTLAIAIYLWAITPVDIITVRYNVQRILTGDPAPSVQISVHPISAEGIPWLLPLLECDDPVIREGVRAMLAERLEQAENAIPRLDQLGWTAFQIADQVVLERLRPKRAEWTRYEDHSERAASLAKFHDYAYQWY
ncbi:MAG: DUF4173 domain-containing protein [Pirellulaceae bacterium]|nr:DUF4173 domain-containing protein [Pirellulaceae bacterium]